MTKPDAMMTNARMTKRISAIVLGSLGRSVIDSDFRVSSFVILFAPNRKNMADSTPNVMGKHRLPLANGPDLLPASEISGRLNASGITAAGVPEDNVRAGGGGAMVGCPPIGPDGPPIEMVGLDSSITRIPNSGSPADTFGGFRKPWWMIAKEA